MQCLHSTCSSEYCRCTEVIEESKKGMVECMHNPPVCFCLFSDDDNDGGNGDGGNGDGLFG